MSSYQIDLTPTLTPTVGVHLNLSPDHIDRHGTFENYANIKARLVENAETAVIGVDDAASAAIARHLFAEHARVRPIATSARLPDGFYLENGRIYDAADGGRAAVLDMTELPNLRGNHNAANVMATLAALEPLSVRPQDIAPA